MKKAMAILAVLAAAAVICGLLFFHNDVTDRFNPFIHQQDVYVQIDRDGRHLSPGGTEYTLDGYNASGKKEEVTFFAGKEPSEERVFEGEGERKVCRDLGRSQV